MTFGIDQLNIYVPRHYLDMATLATARGVDVNKYKVGIGQHKMAVIAPHEDMVTMALEASYDIVQAHKEDIELLLFATESGIDFSKAAGNYVHHMLGLKPNVRILEVKQACYALTGALQLSVDYIKNHPTKKALVISSDIAWYGFNNPGESTQGAGSVAMIVSANPRLAIVGEGTYFTEEKTDFFRPSYQEVPTVDGKLSIRCYNDILHQVEMKTPLRYVCFHMPFANMANKANEQLSYPITLEALNHVKLFTQEVGNIYNGSLYLSLASVLSNGETVPNETIGMFSYGSGSIGEFYPLTLSKNYVEVFSKSDFIQHIESRHEISISTYENWMTQFIEKEKSSDYQTSLYALTKDTKFYLKAIQNGHRIYEKSTF
jgi:hydroxymethylglutaryl-CoA synthase